MINKNQTNRDKTKESSTTYESLSAAVNNDTTTMIVNNRKISLATEGLQPYVENWLKVRTSKENALTISEYVLSLRREQTTKGK